MKKSHLTIAAIILCIGYGVLSWDIITHSAPPPAEDSDFAEMCSSPVSGANAAPGTTIQACCVDYHEALAAIKRDWQANLQKLINQEKPASEMVDDGYESLRTYNCWAEYICRAVEYSGYAPIESVLGTGLKEEHLGIVPGCQSPDNLRMESEYSYFNTGLKDLPIVGLPVAALEYIAEEVVDGVADTFEDFYTENKINFFPRCMTDGDHDNQNPNLVAANNNYKACKAALELDFGCPAGMDEVFCTESANAFVTLDSVLRKRQADQKAAALEKKLGTIVPKLQAMETHVDYLSNFLTQLDARFSCYAGKCS